MSLPWRSHLLVMVPLPRRCKSSRASTAMRKFKKIIIGDLRYFNSKFSSGVYTDSTCSSSNPKIVNHGVTLVGYGTGSSGDYWIVRNSWSQAWGLKGYALIKKGVNMCNIESWAFYAVAA